MGWCQPMTTTPKGLYTKAKKSLDRAVERGHVTERDADAIREFAAAFDEEDMTTPKPDDDQYKAYGTLRSYVNNLRRVAKKLDVELVEATDDDVNELMTAMREDEGKSKNTVRNYQNNVRKFYRYHDFDVDPDDISLISQKEPSVDDRDMLTKDEIARIRDAADHPRDLAVFDLFLYTGQRNTAIRTLRIRDIDLDEGVYFYNTDDGGLKGADENGKKRPLLGATASVREWLRYHPDSDNPDAYLITQKPRYCNPDPTTPVARETLAYAMRQLKEEAGIDKPLHPHAIRHNFVTIAKREFDLDDATVKHLIGHRPDSQVMETTYSHLSDEDFIQAAEVGAGISEPEDESSLTPDICRTCGEPLAPGSKACPACGTVYTPDAQAVKESIDDDVKQSYAQTDPDDEDKMDKVDQIDDLLDDPDVKQALLDRLTDDG